MTTADFRDFLKTLNTKFNNYYAGRLDSKKDCSIGVYSLRNEDRRAVGVTKTFQKSFSLLIHWNSNYNDTEIKAQELFEELGTIQNVKFKSYNLNFIQLNLTEPVDVSTDDKGVFERVIEITVYYNKEGF